MPCTLRRPGRPRALRNERLGPGRSAAPDEDRLVLLPSGPDTVRESPLRGTRSSTSLEASAFEDGDLGREFSPAGADCRYRAPLVPRLARHRECTADASLAARGKWVAAVARVRARGRRPCRSFTPGVCAAVPTPPVRPGGGGRGGPRAPGR